MRMSLLLAGLLTAAGAAFAAGNAANPDAISLEPIPAPVEMKVDMDAPVAFDATTTVTLDCPDAAATKWLSDHLAAWYGAFAPKVVAGKAGLALRDGDEAYALKADAKGVAVAARTLAGARERAAVRHRVRSRAALRRTGHEGQVYRDTGVVDSQIPPSWWLDD